MLSCLLASCDVNRKQMYASASELSGSAAVMLGEMQGIQ